MKHYRAGGGVGTGLEFEHSFPGWPSIERGGDAPVLPGGSTAGSSRPYQHTDFVISSQPWPDAPMAGGVIVIFESRSAEPCMLPYAAIHTHVTEATGAVLLDAVQGSDEPVEVRPGEALQAGISWSSYCGGPGFPEVPARPLTLSVGIEVIFLEGGDIAAGVPRRLEGPGITPGEGGVLITRVVLIPVDTPVEIARSPCTDEVPSSPFDLSLTRFQPFPGPLLPES